MRDIGVLRIQSSKLSQRRHWHLKVRPKTQCMSLCQNLYSMIECCVLLDLSLIEPRGSGMHPEPCAENSTGQKRNRTISNRYQSWQIRSSSPVLDLRSHCHESLLYVCGILRAGLQKGHANLVRKSLQSHYHVHVSSQYTSPEVVSCYSCVKKR